MGYEQDHAGAHQKEQWLYACGTHLMFGMIFSWEIDVYKVSRRLHINVNSNMKLLKTLAVVAASIGLAAAVPDFEFDLQLESSNATFDGQWLYMMRYGEDTEDYIASYNHEKMEDPFYAEIDPVPYIGLDQSREGGGAYFSTLREIVEPNTLYFIQNIVQISQDKHIDFDGDYLTYVGPDAQDKTWRFCNSLYISYGPAGECTDIRLKVVPRE